MASIWLAEQSKATKAWDLQLRSMGMPLDWTLTDEVQALGPIFEVRRAATGFQDCSPERQMPSH